MKTKKNPETPMVPKAHLKNVEHQRDQYKAERDTLINDIAVIRANSERYRKRAENAMDYAERSQCEVLRLEQIRDIKDSALKGAEIKIKTLKQENENLTNRVRKLNLTAQTEHDELMSSDSEVRYWKNLYTTLTNHIRLKAETNPGVSRYIDLVNYIDRLERD